MNNDWTLVVCIADCTRNEDDDLICPQCGDEYGDCECPGPTMDEYEYKEENGKLYARKLGAGNTATLIESQPKE